ncbi:hypothetical protein J3F83DRAFT_561241 [Trichoderma novae-zelandiae]
MDSVAAVLLPLLLNTTTAFLLGDCTPQISAFAGDGLRNAFRFSLALSSASILRTCASDLEASETQAAPGREKRSRRHPWNLTIDPPMHNDGAASRVLLLCCVCLVVRTLTSVSAIASIFAELVFPQYSITGSGTITSQIGYKTLVPSTDPDIEETREPLSAARPAPNSVQQLSGHFHAHVVRIGGF